MPYIVTSACMLCGACVAGCESNAIEEGDTQSYIDVDLCVECGTCERNCPFDAIVFVDVAETAGPTGGQHESGTKAVCANRENTDQETQDAM